MLVGSGFSFIQPDVQLVNESGTFFENEIRMDVPELRKFFATIVFTTKGVTSPMGTSALSCIRRARSAAGIPGRMTRCHFLPRGSGWQGVTISRFPIGLVRSRHSSPFFQEPERRSAENCSVQVRNSRAPQ